MARITIDSTLEARHSAFAATWRRLARRKGAVLGLGFIALVVIVAVFAPLIAQFSPIVQNYKALKVGPSLVHWFGTDELGRDIFSRIAYGARASMLAGVSSVVIALVLGVPVGIASGYLGGWLDAVISRVVDATLAIPYLVLAIALAAILGPSLVNAMFAIGVAAAPRFVRLTRGQVLSVASEDYVEAARALGNPGLRIAFRHIFPNILPVLIVQATLTLASAITSEASLSFLGLGQQPPFPSWGAMLNTAQRSLATAPWIAVWPGLAIFLTVLSFNLLGDGLRDALDPRTR